MRKSCWNEIYESLWCFGYELIYCAERQFSINMQSRLTDYLRKTNDYSNWSPHSGIQPADRYVELYNVECAYRSNWSTAFMPFGEKIFLRKIHKRNCERSIVNFIALICQDDGRNGTQVFAFTLLRIMSHLSICNLNLNYDVLFDTQFRASLEKLNGGKPEIARKHRKQSNWI